MNDNASTLETTYTLGYYNPAKWPITLMISKFNCSIPLEPNQFILDKQGRKINDPFFDCYGGKLAKAVSDKLVPLLKLPVQQSMSSVPDGQSVRVVTEFKTDAKGQRQPVIPQPRITEPRLVSQPSHVAMSIEEARKAGFIGKVREVPEDYGAADTDLSPPRQVPEMKYAVEAPPKAVPVVKVQERETIVEAVEAPVAEIVQPEPEFKIDLSQLAGATPITQAPEVATNSDFPCKCPECGAGFKDKTRVKVHIKSSHLDKYDALISKI